MVHGQVKKVSGLVAERTVEREEICVADTGDTATSYEEQMAAHQGEQRFIARREHGLVALC